MTFFQLEILFYVGKFLLLTKLALQVIGSVLSIRLQLKTRRYIPRKDLKQE